MKPPEQNSRADTKGGDGRCDGQDELGSIVECRGEGQCHGSTERDEGEGSPFAAEASVESGDRDICNADGGEVTVVPGEIGVACGPMNRGSSGGGKEGQQCQVNGGAPEVECCRRKRSCESEGSRQLPVMLILPSGGDGEDECTGTEGATGESDPACKRGGSSC